MIILITSDVILIVVVKSAAIRLGARVDWGHFPGCKESGVRHEPGAGDGHPRADWARADAHEADAARSPGQDLRDALGQRLTQPSLGQPGREADRVGQPHHEQGARDTAALVVGDDLRLRPQRLVRRVRRPRQHLQHIQPEEPRGQRARLQGAAWPHRLPQLLSLPRRQPDRHQQRRHVMVSASPHFKQSFLMSQNSNWHFGNNPGAFF